MGYIFLAVILVCIMRIAYKLDKETKKENLTAEYVDVIDPLFLSEGEEIVDGKYRRVE